MAVGGEVAHSTLNWIRSIVILSRTDKFKISAIGSFVVERIFFEEVNYLMEDGGEHISCSLRGREEIDRERRHRIAA